MRRWSGAPTRASQRWRSAWAATRRLRTSIAKQCSRAETSAGGFGERLDRRGIELVALNASGNPLHPNPDVAQAHGRALRGAVELAAELGVSRVVAMSGCPGGPGSPGSPGSPGGPGGGRWPVFAGGAWLPDMEGLWDWQWEHAIAPYWQELSAWAASAAPDVDICLELHPGTSIYNVASYQQLREVCGGNVKVNLDPSHFWWQGIDPVTCVRALGDSVGFVHGKDTIILCGAGRASWRARLSLAGRRRHDALALLRCRPRTPARAMAGAALRAAGCGLRRSGLDRARGSDADARGGNPGLAGRPARAAR